MSEIYRGFGAPESLLKPIFSGESFSSQKVDLYVMMAAKMDFVIGIYGA